MVLIDMILAISLAIAGLVVGIFENSPAAAAVFLVGAAMILVYCDHNKRLE